jgi:hypothetical protein
MMKILQEGNGQEDVSVNPDLLKLIHQQESSLSNSPAMPAVARQQGSSHTVPEPCPVAPERRSSGPGNCAPIPHPTVSGGGNLILMMVCGCKFSSLNT